MLVKEATADFGKIHQAHVHVADVPHNKHIQVIIHDIRQDWNKYSSHNA